MTLPSPDAPARITVGVTPETDDRVSPHHGRFAADLFHHAEDAHAVGFLLFVRDRVEKRLWIDGRFFRFRFLRHRGKALPSATYRQKEAFLVQGNETAALQYPFSGFLKVDRFMNYGFYIFQTGRLYVGNVDSGRPGEAGVLNLTESPVPFCRCPNIKNYVCPQPSKSNPNYCLHFGSRAS